MDKVCEHDHLSSSGWIFLDLRVAPVWPMMAPRAVHAYITMADLSGSMDDTEREKNCTVLFSFKSTSSQGPRLWPPLHFPFYHIDRAVRSHKQGRLPLSAVTKRFQESLTEVVKNLGLFMSLCIDLTLVRMNCRSIGLPLGRLNEQSTTPGPCCCLPLAS